MPSLITVPSAKLVPSSPRWAGAISFRFPAACLVRPGRQQVAVHDDFHRPADRDADDSSLLVHPAIGFEDTLVPGM